MKYNYRVYGTTKTKGYELLKITEDESKAFSYNSNSNYEKVMIIRHDFENNYDEPISLAFPNAELRKVKRK